MEFTDLFIFLMVVNSITGNERTMVVAETEVGIRFNKLEPKYENTMPVGPRTYLDLIKSGTFVDKSSLIYDVLVKVGKPAVAITYPPKWGKSINLDMLKTFLEIRVDENGTRKPLSENQNYRLFCEGKYNENGVQVELNQPLLISNRNNYRVFDEFLGKHPVVYLSFKNSAVGYDSKNYTELLKKTIADAYERHKYMIKVFTNAGEMVTYKAKRFYECMTGKTDELLYAINFLSHQLHDYFKTKVVVMVDNYDTIFKIKSIDMTFYLDFLDLALNRNDYACRCIVTSNFPVVMYKDFLTYNDFFTCFNFYSFYGYSEPEMKLLFDHFNVTGKEKETVKKWYGGYVTSGNAQVLFSHPWSVNSYMNERQTSDYWMRTTNYGAYLKDFFIGPLIGTLEELVNGTVIVEGSIYDFVLDVHEFEFLHDLNTVREGCKDFALKCLFLEGFLTIDDIRNLTSEYRVSYRMPNEEIRTRFAKVYEDIVRSKPARNVNKDKSPKR